MRHFEHWRSEKRGELYKYSNIINKMLQILYTFFYGHIFVSSGMCKSVGCELR